MESVSGVTDSYAEPAVWNQKPHFFFSQCKITRFLKLIPGEKAFLLSKESMQAIAVVWRSYFDKLEQQRMFPDRYYFATVRYS